MRNRQYDRYVCEDFLRIDIRELCLEPAASVWQYPAGPIAVMVAATYARFVHDGLDYVAVIERTPCNYGGSRPWFLCPRCGDRRAVLFGSPRGGTLGCRRCLKLLFLSECDDAFGRAIHKLRKIERQICEPSTGLVGTARPRERLKGQHLRAYGKHLAKLYAARQTLLRIWSNAQNES